MKRTLPFYDYEKGTIGEDELYTILESQFSIPAARIAQSCHSARAAVQVNTDIVDLMRRVKASTNIRVYGIANISASDRRHLHDTLSEDVWSIFDGVLCSADVGQRMPNLAFFHCFMEVEQLDPGRCAFFSSKLEHVISATSCGMTGLPLESWDELEGALRELTHDAVTEGDAYLRAHAGKMRSTTNTGVELQENFAQLLMLEVTGDPSLVDLPRPERRMRFFRGDGVLTTKNFPPDVDTTSIACTTMGDRYSDDAKNSILDEITVLRNEDGITLTYYDPGRPRIDPVVCVNVLTFFHANGRGDELPETLHWIYNVLQTRAYVSGTQYYVGADTFLYFLSRLLAIPRPLPQALHSGLTGLFKERIEERFGQPGDALALAMRVLAAASVGLSDRRGSEKLLALQEADGAWPTGWVYKYGMCGVLVGNKGITTAMAVAAIRGYRRVQGIDPDMRV